MCYHPLYQTHYRLARVVLGMYFHVAAGNAWHVILDSSILRQTKTVTNIGSTSVTLQTSAWPRFTPQPWISKLTPRIYRQKNSLSNLPQVGQLVLHPQKLHKDYPVKSLSASTSRNVPTTRFDSYTEVFLAQPNVA